MLPTCPDLGSLWKRAGRRAPDSADWVSGAERWCPSTGRYEQLVRLRVASHIWLEARRGPDGVHGGVRGHQVGGTGLLAEPFVVGALEADGRATGSWTWSCPLETGALCLCGGTLTGSYADGLPHGLWVLDQPNEAGAHQAAVRFERGQASGPAQASNALLGQGSHAAGRMEQGEEVGTWVESTERRTLDRSKPPF